MDAGPSTSDAGPSPGDAGSDASSPLHACCLIDGTCADRSAADCTAQPRFHSYQPMFFCDSFTCPDERQGACCDGEGNCMDGVTVDACGGGHRGEGTTCAMVDCAAP